MKIAQKAILRRSNDILVLLFPAGAEPSVKETAGRDIKLTLYRHHFTGCAGQAWKGVTVKLLVHLLSCTFCRSLCSPGLSNALAIDGRSD